MQNLENNGPEGPRVSHVALVGCGFTGTSALYQLIDRHPVSKITVFETTGDFGPGYAYRTEENAHYLLNNTTDSMGLAPLNRRAFLSWLEQRLEPNDPRLDPKGHVPRPLFGAFLKEAVSALTTLAAIKGIELDLIPHAVTAVSETKDHVTLTWPHGSIQADAAILTTGRAPDKAAFPSSAGGDAVYFDSHLNCSGLDDIPLTATLHVMGASLSAYDVVNRMFCDETGCKFERAKDGHLLYVPGPNKRRLVLCSRSGRLKSLQSQYDGTLERTAFTKKRLSELGEKGPLSLAKVGALIKEEAKAHGTQLSEADLTAPYASCRSDADLQAKAISLMEKSIAQSKGGPWANFLVDLFQDAAIDIWDGFADQTLSEQDERAYRHRAESAVLSYAAPCPLPTGEKLLALMRSGHLKIVTGVTSVTLADGAPYRIHHAYGTEEADYLVNTTGSVARDLRDAEQDPLTQQLVTEGLLKPYDRTGLEAYGAAVDMRTFKSKGAQRIYVANMMLWGPGFFTSSAFMMATIVERLLAKMFGDLSNS